jgi:ferredoxin
MTRRSIVKVVVDFDECASNAVCMGILPEVFEVRDDGYLYVLDEHPPESMREKLRQAVNGCPTGAISIAEDD